MRNTYGQHINRWALKVKNLLNELGFPYMFENQNINDIDVHIIIRRIYDQYLQQWSTDIRASPKGEVYCMIKSDNNLEIEKYITVVKNNCRRIALTRIRCSAHKLLIEEGRY